jgi:hypothetical protein
MHQKIKENQNNAMYHRQAENHPMSMHQDRKVNQPCVMNQYQKSKPSQYNASASQRKP